MGAIREIKQKYFGEGDLEAFFGLFGDVFSKIAAIIGVLYFAEGFPADIVMGKILPGIGVGSIAGSLIYFWEAYDLGKKEGRTDVTALPFGVSSTQVFAWIYLIIVPIYRQTGNALHAWQVAVAASYVMSVDGKIAFEDNEVGPMIAKTNHLDKDGATADFWVLNLLRANCDGIIIGSGTMIKEPDYSGSAYDPDLLQARIDNGKSVAPWTVIVTTTGKNIPFGNPVFSQEEIPMLVATSEEGIKNLKQEITKEYYELPLVKTEEDKKKIKELIAENEGKIAVLVTGEGKNTDAAEMLKVLRAMGMEKVLVESPTYCHHMMREGLLDEIFINTSCIFVGGQATGIGTSSKSFPSTDHPHSEIVTMHMHSPHFIYTRYKMLYGIK